jgi:hypothetical protein
MKRTTLAASLVGSATAGLIAAATATPAWSQATTFPDGTDCGSISDSASREECMTQLNESRQVPATGQVVPDPDGTGNIQPGSPADLDAASPDSSPTGNPSTNTPGGIDNTPPESGSGTDTDNDATN